MNIFAHMLDFYQEVVTKPGSIFGIINEINNTKRLFSPRTLVTCLKQPEYRPPIPLFLFKIFLDEFSFIYRDPQFALHCYRLIGIILFRDSPYP